MQPPRPFPGASYDKNMFTFLPSPSNSDVLTESSRKRKLSSSHHQISLPPSSVGYGLEMPDPKLNTSGWRGKVLQTSVPSFPSGESLHSGDVSHESRDWGQNGYVASGDFDKRDLSSFTGQLSSPSHKDFLPKFVHQPLVDSGARVVGSNGKGGQTRDTLVWPPVTGDFNQHTNHQSNAHLAGGENAFQFQEFRNFGFEKPVQMNVVAAGSHELASNNLQQSHIIRPGASSVDADKKCYPEETYNTESSSSVKQVVDPSTLAGCDSARLLGDNVFNLQQTNELLQNAIRLLSASGVDLAGSLGGKVLANTVQDKSMKPLPDSVSQNISCPQMETSISKNEACPSLDKSGPNGEKDSLKVDQEHKSGNGAPTLAEKLWDGNLQLSSGVTVSAIAFFKSGEKMMDFSWSGTVEIKGKVRLEAFEKYVQNLPRSRNRGLMVMSLRLKEGSSDSCYKGLQEVGRKYKDGKKVGFAQLSRGVDLYVCPNSDTIITILAKYGFLKGMTAALDKSDQLLGCVVWRKNTPLATSTITEKIINPPSDQPSLTSPSKTVPSPVAGENSTVPVKSQGLSSKKDEKLTETGEKSGDRSPKIAQTKLVLVSGSDAQLSELQADREVYKPKQSAPTCDDDDLPEYDFRFAASQTSANKPFSARTVEPKLDAEQFNSCQISLPQTRMERSTDPIAPPGFHFQGQVPQNIRHQSESHVLKLPTDPRKLISEEITRQNATNFQGLSPNNIHHKPQGQTPSLPLPLQKHIGNMPNPKPRNLYDDDDMPEWRPPIITNPRQELAQRPSQPIVSAPALSQRKPRDNEYRFAPQDPRTFNNKPTVTGFVDKGVAGPTGFGLNPAFRPRFDPPGRNNPIHPTSWKGLGP